MISKHIPVLQIVIPLMAAPLTSLLRKSGVAWFFALLVTVVSFAMSGMLLAHVSTVGPIDYYIGDWLAPWGIQYRVDLINAYVLQIVTGIALLVLLFAPHSVEREIPEEQHYLFYTAFLLSMTGLLGITITGDAFNIFVFLEIASLSSYTLISLGKTRKALTSSFQYLAMGTIGGTFILIGIGLLYMKTGSLNIADISHILKTHHLYSSRTILASFAFVVVGISIKLAFFPLHFWLPNAYAYAPSVVTAFIASTATKVSFYMMLRFLFSIYTIAFVKRLQLDVILLPLALAAILVASAVAMYQKNVKRLLAFSSVAQIGYMVLGLSFLTVDGLAAGILHLFNHALMKGALFLAMGAIFYRIGSAHLDDMRGIGKQMPWTMLAFSLGGLSLIGVPLTAGFVSKWNLLMAAMKLHLWVVALLILVASLLAVVYVWKVVEVAYFQDPPKGRVVQEAPLSMLAPLWILIAANIYFGISTQLTVGVATRAAKMLLGVTP